MTNTNQAFSRPLACVTGASAGLGREFALQLAQRGFDLLLVARDLDRLTALAEELSQQHGITATAHQADLSRDEPMRTLAEKLSKEERLMVLVNNAGFGTKGKLATRPVGEQATMLELHVMAPMLLTRAVIPKMIERREGFVITVASVASFTASQGNVNYCATKAYQRVFMEGLAQELAGTGVRVQALCPGFTHTEFHDRMQIDKTKGIPSWAWLNADRVVRESLEQAFGGGPTVVIPGKRYRTVVFALRHMPMWLRGLMQERYGRARV
ncbi:MAG: SDR family oxidoreductase [Gemmatimonadaceae bacterium]|nr:SDR family oxidoreductase [Gemmatimonadaceae bacterium]MCW5826765.1 SDR family oxidoreductase [Gemmatimonadaceae bacterium]